MTLRQFLLSLLVLLALPTIGSAQTEEDRARDDLDYYNRNRGNDRRRAPDGFGRDLWFGAGAQLGFSSGNGTSNFIIGVSPMVGYKITPNISFGPRASVTYNSLRFEFLGGGIERNRWASYSGGLFGRVKVFNQFFAHAEYSILSDREFFQTTTGALDNVRVTRAIPYLGGGFTQGGVGGPGYEIMILFRLTQPDRINDRPFEIRTGLNYNF